MLLRRVFMLSPLLLSAPALAEPDGAKASDFIRDSLDELVQLVTGAGDFQARRQRLQPFIERVVDVDGVARFCLGRYWQVASDEQRAEYSRLFHAVLVNSITGHLGEYQPGQVRLTTGRASPRPEGLLVPTTIERPNNKPVSIGWLVTEDGGRYRVTDVVAEGVSLRVTQRSDYAAFLSHNNGEVRALIDAMRRQVDGTKVSQR